LADVRGEAAAVMRNPSGARPDVSADRARALALTPVSREAAARLDDFVSLLLKWQPRTNLIAPSTMHEVWTRHIADSLQLMPLAPDARTWVDLGSGGGFPGLMIACALPDRDKGWVHLIERNAKKAAFLREAARLLKIPALVHAARIAEFGESFHDSPDVVTARGLAPLSALLAHAEPLLKRGAQGLFLKGQDVEAELTLASKYWNIDAEFVPSKTSAQGRILRVRRAERR
jgi:16S rRNA (guanine527-N7)-methyltransferase